MAESRVVLVGWPERGAQMLQAGVEFQQSLYAAASDIGTELRARAIQESPVGKTPALDGTRFRDSWVTEVDPEYQGGARVTLGNSSPHALFVIDPTRPHSIYANHIIGESATTSGPRPLRGIGGGLGFLRFDVGGETHFAHMVNHPGTPGNPVHERVDAQMQPRYQEIVQQRAGELAARIESIFH